MQVIKTKIRTKCQVAAVKADGFVYKGRMKSRVFGRRPPVAPRQFDQFLLTSPSSLYSIPQLPFISFFLAYSELLWRPLGRHASHLLSVRIRWFTFTVVFRPPVMLPSTCVFFCVSLEKWQCVSHVVIAICCLVMS